LLVVLEYLKSTLQSGKICAVAAYYTCIPGFRFRMSAEKLTILILSKTSLLFFLPVPGKAEPPLGLTAFFQIHRT